MEKHSFTNNSLAKLFNKYFICIKVDREEMPQIDAKYQALFLQYKKHAGGWPLSVFMTPKKEVFYITTYIPPSRKSYAEGFDTLLPKLHKLYQNPKALQKKIYAITHATQPKIKMKQKLGVKDFVQSLQKEYEPIYVGFGHGRKFPQVAKTALLLDLGLIEDNKKLQEEYFDTLDIMALRGLYDHVDGGFFRYTTDAAWEIPHFEKMLYVQAGVIPLYVRGYALREKPLYRDVVKETIAMVERRFEKNNLFWSASDADTQGKEGAFFTFTQAEIKKALQNNPHATAIEDAMGFSIEGNFHGRVHINFESTKRPKGFDAFQKALQKVQQKRTYPFIDKKINCAWNAMMIKALYKAAYIDDKYATKANRSLEALKNLFFIHGELYHQTVSGHKPTQKGLLEDYSYFIAALIAGYESDYDTQKLDFAEYLLSVAKRKFYRDGRWYLSDDGLNVLAGLNDKYYTSPLSQMVQNIMQLAALKASFRYEKFAQESMQQLELQLQLKKADAPALTQAYLMQKFGVVVIKSSKENLVKHTNKKIIYSINYPYVLTEKKPYDDYLACTIGRCFIKDKSLKNVAMQINRFIK